MPKRDDTIYGRIPPLDPNSAWDYNQQLQSLYGAYFDMLSQLRYQGAQLRSGFRSQMQGIGQAETQNLTDAEGNALERGVLGGSTDLQNRVDVRGSAETARAQARAAKGQGLMDLNFQRMQAKRALEQGLINAQAFADITRSNAAIQQFATGSITGGGAPPAPGPAPATTGALGQRIDVLLRAYSQAAPPMRAEIRRALILEWAKRNAALRQSGQTTIPRARLEALMAKAANAADPRGGKV